jgi:hypothetical protein
LIDRDSNKPVPLKSINLDVKIINSLSAFEMTQYYINEEENPLETIFLFPVDMNVAFSKITADFKLKDGSIKHVETIIEEREKVEAKYEEAIATG